MSTRPIFDPELLPVESTGIDLAPVPAERLSVGGLRRRFTQTLGWSPEAARDDRWTGERALRRAAVLIPLVDRPTGVSVLLTQRTAHLTDHAGQISFPGGSCEAADADATATALREAQEEVGLDAERVEVLGTLPDYVTGTGFVVSPVAGLIHPPFELQPDDFEVAEVFEVPLAFLMDPRQHEVRLFRWDGGERRFFAMPYPKASGAGHYFVWGATAAILRNLYRFLSA